LTHSGVRAYPTQLSQQQIYRQPVSQIFFQRPFRSPIEDSCLFSPRSFFPIEHSFSSENPRSDEFIRHYVVCLHSFRAAPCDMKRSLKKSDTFDCTIRQRSDLIEFSYLNDSDLIYSPENQASEEPAASFPQRHFFKINDNL